MPKTLLRFGFTVIVYTTILAIEQQLSSTLMLFSISGLSITIAIIKRRTLLSKYSNHWSWIFILPSIVYFICLGIFYHFNVLVKAQSVALSFSFLYCILLFIAKHINYHNHTHIYTKIKVTREIAAELQYEVSKSKNVIYFLKRSLQDVKKLIAIDSERADEFIQCLNKIIRYLLHSRNEKTVRLNEELETLSELHRLHFLENNLAIILDISINKAVGGHQYAIPPFVLQIIMDRIFELASYLQQNKIELYIENERYLVIKYDKKIPTTSLNQDFKFVLLELQQRYKYIGEFASIQTIVAQKNNYIKLPLLKAD